MSRQYSGFIFQQSHDGIVKNVSTNVRIDSGKRIIHQDKVCIEVDSPSNVESLFLAARYCYTTFTNLGSISLRKHVEIGLESTGIDNIAIPLLDISNLFYTSACQNAAKSVILS
jgi:hypothetical protein